MTSPGASTSFARTWMLAVAWESAIAAAVVTPASRRTASAPGRSTTGTESRDGLRRPPSDVIETGAPASGMCWQNDADDERAAVDDGQAALDQLLERLTDAPAPAGPTPRRPGTPATASLLPIVEVRSGGPAL
ncbi:hypothetical protein [Streptomyces sp. MK5]|uniref:hypothetical protein n=1 Tax=Streptomyces sp. MK5 TaxID=3064253 RepID=UPI0027420FDA|nr:hypothetical protein [Streptomyces sp. MK5]